RRRPGRRPPRRAALATRRAELGACGRCYHATMDWAAGHELPDPVDSTSVDDARVGVWRYRPRLPIGEPRNIVSLGEGGTPVVELPRWGGSVGAARAMVKLEQIAPTGSFKDRGMTLVVSRAKELGARELLEDSSGNAGASTSAYAARAGIP